MNRKWFVSAGIVSVLLILGACASKPSPPKFERFDENLPLEESACLYFSNNLSKRLIVKEYNGIAVPVRNWWDNKKIYYPPGEMEFLVDSMDSVGNTDYIVIDVKFKYTFEADKLYYLIPTSKGGLDGKTWGVDITEIPSKDLSDIKYQDRVNFIAFAPFYNNVVGDSKTSPRVLE